MTSGSNFAHICSQFRISGTYIHSEKLDIGLIHGSFKVHTSDAIYFLQEINTKVFRDVAGMMQNIALVTETLRPFTSQSGYETLQLIPTQTGSSFLSSEAGSWRMFAFLEGMQSYDVPQQEAMVEEAARAFAWFAKSLQPLDPSLLEETIPRFHSLAFRLGQLKEAINQYADRAAGVDEEIQAMEALAEKLLPLEDAWRSGQLPTRITHNDTKFNNLLFDKQDQAVCVIDLDTVMPGIIHFDIGDGLRTLASSAVEDEADLSKVFLLEDRYQRFIASYLEVFESVITPAERRFIHYAAPYMALIMAVRFLTDYIQGNLYYPIRYEEHNLVRARCQLKMTKEFLQKGNKPT